MAIVYNTLLTIHIISGGFGLILGTVNIFRKKGDEIHKNVGKGFTTGMILAGVTAIVLSIIHPNFFLFMVGIFTLYMILTGLRYLRLKQTGSHQPPKLIDKCLTCCMLVASFVFIGIGISDCFAFNSFGLVSITFGSLGLGFVFIDYKNYQARWTNRMYWLLAHIQRMTGAYIASLTAFLVVNSHHFPKSMPSTIFWLLPTALLTPKIIQWSKQIKLKGLKPVLMKPESTL